MQKLMLINVVRHNETLSRLCSKILFFNQSKALFGSKSCRGWIAQWALQMEAVLSSYFLLIQLNLLPWMHTAAAEHDSHIQHNTEA